MKIHLYGTRGSIPISNPDSKRYGGNTTCLQVISPCLPQGTVLIIDAGSGFVPASSKLLKDGVKEVMVLLTHYHHDHTGGLLLSPLTFIKSIKMTVCGVVEGGIGPKEMMKGIMKPPFFPVDFKEVGSHFSFKGFDLPRSAVIVFHPVEGCKFFNIDEYEGLLKKGKHIPVGKGKRLIDECLVVTMYKSNHPEQTISFRLEEKPTGKVFVFLTDHENSDGISNGLKAHLAKTDLLIMDSQYSREVYDLKTAGFGHGTPDYCVRVAEAVGAKRLGLTHHDPASTDADIDRILREAELAATGNEFEMFACADYQEVDV